MSVNAKVPAVFTRLSSNVAQNCSACDKKTKLILAMAIGANKNVYKICPTCAREFAAKNPRLDVRYQGGGQRKCTSRD